MNEIKINHSGQLPRGEDRLKLLLRRDGSLGYHSFLRCERMTKLEQSLAGDLYPPWPLPQQ